MRHGRALPSTITIDDTFPSRNNEVMTYDPPNAWNTKDACPGGLCCVFLDADKVHSGTWHESTAKQSPDEILTATTEFRGSAVHVYAVLPPLSPNLAPTTAVMFYIDGVLTKEFSASPGTEYLYNTLVYENSSLPFDSHNLTIVNGKSGGRQSLFILDRIDYSIPNDDPSTIVPTNTSPTSSSNVLDRTPIKLSLGGIMGIILGSLAGMITLVIMILYLRRRRRKMDDTQNISPWVLEGPTAPYSRPEKGRRMGGNSGSGAAIMGGRPPSYHSHGHMLS